MTASISNIRKRVREFDFNGLFIEELGWDRFSAARQAEVDGVGYELAPLAEKRGFQVFRCSPNPDGTLPNRVLRQKIDGQVAKQAMEHLIVYTDRANTLQQWQWALREPERPVAYRENHFQAGDTGQRLAEKLQHLFFSIDDEERLTLVDVSQRVSLALRKDRVTKRFYERFDKERKAFLPKIDGIVDIGIRDWYASIMLNRLMFVYFVQKKGFLNGDPNYLRNKLAAVQQQQGRDQFYSYYREFLLTLFHEGLAKQKPRSAEIEQLLGDVPYLNGGIFDIHQIEQTNPDIQIPDEAFETIFAFFDSYDWHLDDRALRDDQQINPDVLGYIFEKYINQKQMGAYYTKEDITEYISKNTIVPFLFDAAKQDCAIAFRPDGALWGLLQDNPDRYIYDAVKTGVTLDIPADILAGKHDVANRGGWNRPAAEGYGLPTETWREYMARRDRYYEIGGKLLAGEVTTIDDLITYNLDIRQFAQDVIQHAEGPDLVRAFYKAIREVSVLDPSCGSGAFPFAALNILHPLYDACLERMEEFVDALERNPEPQHPNKYSDFKDVLKEMGQHTNRDYAIFKSIIARNLYGVDIMEEAVEICKLRLFLKLASKLEPGLPIEPLPDIDFNIRAGNTLVGFTSMDDVRRAALIDARGNARLPLPDDIAALDRLEEQAAIADRKFEMFREQQTKHGGTITAANKADLRHSLRALSDELDRYLARLYNIVHEDAQSTLDYQQRFSAWRESHLPFHWLIDFYGIMQRGGFDVIIGNPPYVEYKDVKQDYQVINLLTLPCGDLYSYVVERSIALATSHGRTGMIVPISMFGTDGFAELQELSLRAFDHLWVSSFANRPSQLFEGAQKRLTIFLARNNTGTAIDLWTTEYSRWFKDERNHLFASQLEYNRRETPFHFLPLSLEKLGHDIESSAFQRIASSSDRLGSAVIDDSRHLLFYTRKFGYFLSFLDFIPEVVNAKTREVLAPSELKRFAFQSDQEMRVAIAGLSSTTFFWFWNTLSDCRNLNRRDLVSFPLNPARIDRHHAQQLTVLAVKLLDNLRSSSRMMTKGDLRIQTFDYSSCKPIIDEIDRVLAEHYGFTDEELDFIINYDIKYRMGRDGLTGDEARADE